MNNSIYNFLYDSIINTYLMNHCGLRPTDGDQYGLVGETTFSSYRTVEGFIDCGRSRLTIIAPASALSQRLLWLHLVPSRRGTGHAGEQPGQVLGHVRDRHV